MAKRKALLMISNSQILMDMTKRILERDDYRVKCAADENSAKELLDDYSFDGIIVDGELTDCDSISCLRDVLALGGAPALFMSENQENELPALTAGACDFIKKPYSLDLLRARINIMLREFPADTVRIVPKVSSTGTYEDVLINASAFKPDAIADARGIAPAAESSVIPVSAMVAAINEKRAVPDGGRVSLKKQVCQALALAAGFALVFMLVISSPYLGRTLFSPADGVDGVEGVVITDDTVPLGTAESADGFIRIPAIGKIVVSVSDGVATLDVPLVNHGDNSCAFIFELTLIDTDESLFISELIAPGSAVSDIVLSTTPDAGSYAARLSIEMFTIAASGGENPIQFAKTSLEFPIEIV